MAIIAGVVLNQKGSCDLFTSVSRHAALKVGAAKSAASTCKPGERMRRVCLFVFFSPATVSVFLQQKHPVVYVAIIPCDMGSQGEGIGGLGEKDRGWQL